ncbi:hypothetical protein TSUD_220360 [Trifolium subterraneum]|uniref:Transposase (putative) gypsy type domain-containing protein n=1 Tax=Trifolium subterraneum TaxID=3900 RepID=A0A2Z6P3C4_TRISU|nr:hypothetical protein TSUD_220360 [Trifolium subterraneum]
MSQIRRHFTRANGSLNEKGFYSEVFGFPVSSSDSEDSSEAGSTSTSSSSDCVIISRSSSTGKNIVLKHFVAGEMDVPSRFNSPEMVACFRAVVKLCGGGVDECQIIFDPVGEGELVTTQNTVEPHHFYMYASVIQALNLWFPLTSFEGTVLRVLNVAPSQLQPNSWAFVKAFELICHGLGLEPSVGVFFSFYQVKSLTPGKLVSINGQPNRGSLYFLFTVTSNLMAIKGVNEAHLTSFEKEVVVFLDSFNLFVIKDLIQNKGDHQGLVACIKRMRTIYEDEFTAFLEKSKQKKLQLDAPGDLDAQLVIADPEVVSVDVSLGNDVVVDKGSPRRALRPRQKGVAGDPSLNDVGGSVPDAPTVPLGVSSGVVSLDDVGEAAWSDSFDPIEFMDHHFSVKGDPSRFASIPTADLRRKALNSGVRGLMITHLLADRQEREVISERARADRSSRDEAVKLGKEKEDAMAQLKVTHAGELDRMKKTHDFDQALWRRRINGERTLRDALIVSCAQAGKDMMALQDYADELKATNNALKEGMADKYLDGFTFAVEQFKVVFPDLDPELVSQIDVMKKVDGG